MLVLETKIYNDKNYLVEKSNITQTMLWIKARNHDYRKNIQALSSLFMHTCISWTWSNSITDYDHFRISQSLPLTQLQIQHFQFFVTQSSSRRACMHRNIFTKIIMFMFRLFFDLKMSQTLSEWFCGKAKVNKIQPKIPS